MRVLRWICGHIRNDRIQNDYVWEKISVAPTEEKMTENRLKWFGHHVQRRPLEVPIRRVDCTIFKTVKRRPKRTLEEINKGDWDSS